MSIKYSMILSLLHILLCVKMCFSSMKTEDTSQHEKGKIILVQPHFHEYFDEEINSYYLERFKVFKQKLGWNIPVQENKDIDQYDTPQTTYLLYKDKKYGVCGGMRFVPTTEPYMLRNTFSHLLPTDVELPHNAHIWDLSRFFYNRPLDQRDSITGSRQGTVKLMLSILEFAVHFALKGLVTVTDTLTESICLRIGLPLKRISDLHHMGDSEAACFFIPADRPLLEKLKAKYKIKGPLIWVPLPLDLSHLDSSLKKSSSKL